jgi:hypothetical protein
LLLFPEQASLGLGLINFGLATGDRELLMALGLIDSEQSQLRLVFHTRLVRTSEGWGVFLEGALGLWRGVMGGAMHVQLYEERVFVSKNTAAAVS